MPLRVKNTLKASVPIPGMPGVFLPQGMSEQDFAALLPEQ